MTRLQCSKCPWKKSTDPCTIPRGYSKKKHRALKDTIAESPLASVLQPLRIMACHDTHEEPCVGWLMNQLGPGNNIALRLAVSRGRISADVETVGDQHANFDETLPR